MDTHKPTRIKDLAETTRDQYLLDPRKIRIEAGYNPRDLSLPEKLRRLAKAIETGKKIV